MYLQCKLGLLIFFKCYCTALHAQQTRKDKANDKPRESRRPFFFFSSPTNVNERERKKRSFASASLYIRDMNKYKLYPN